VGQRRPAGKTESASKSTIEIVAAATTVQLIAPVTVTEREVRTGTVIGTGIG